MSSNKHHQSTVEMFELMDKGLTSQEARKVVLPHKPVSKQGDYLLQQKHKQYSLTQPKIVRKAAKVYQNALDGKPLTKNSADKPNNTHILQVAKEVMDRVEPKITRNENLSINIDLSPVDLNSYLNAVE